MVIYGSLGLPSGGYLYDRQLVHALQQAGHQVHVVALPWRGYVGSLLDNWRVSVRRALTDAGVDVWIQDELNHPSLWRWNRHRPWGDAPVISLVHHLRSNEAWPWPWRSLYRAVERAYVRSVDAFIYNSRTTRAEVTLLSGRPRPGVVAYPAADHIARTGLDDAMVVARARHAGPLRVLFVGNLIPRKGLHRLLRALAQLPAEAAVLDVVGSDTFARSYAQQVRALATDLGLSGRVHWHGHVHGDALRALFTRSHVLAVPSDYEGFGIVYLEAMAYGLPVLATAYGAAWELVTPGQTGYLVTPNEAGTRAMAAYLRRWHHDRERLATMGRAALARFRAHPTWAQSLQRAVTFVQAWRTPA
ncbi:MAG: glycosyltransferase family 4 protein [Chloroflexi bacterium]|nr:glycosyltransferase family 4 protein [Chloroflexota bacterium]